MGAYTIRELENLSGIKAHTIRIWEKRYGLIAPERTSTNIRFYCDTELKKLLNISILNRHGLKISKIAMLSSVEMVEKINHLTQNITSAEGQIESLTVAMIDIDEYRFEQILARAIIQFGFEEAVKRVLFPFMVRIGLMWQTGSINAAQEHFISNLVRQKFFVAIDGLVVQEKPGARRIVFFLPEGELHEIGLLLMCYLAKKFGHHTIYLGQSVPINDLAEMISIRPVDGLVTCFTTSINGNNIQEYVRSLSEKFRDKFILLSGPGSYSFPFSLPSNITPISSPAEFISEMELITRPR
jgi:DNA-binding transcriptional MerR regulator